MAAEEALSMLASWSLCFVVTMGVHISPGELRRQIAVLLRAGTSPIVPFLHTYSLIDIDNGLKPDECDIGALDCLLLDIRKNFGGELLTLAQAARHVTADAKNTLSPLSVVTSDLLWRDIELTP
jgi:hypothetical protein